MLEATPDSLPIRLVLGGDLMTGRGIDQILPFPSDPSICEDWRNVFSAEHFVRLAEAANGLIPRPVSNRYVWGDALLAMAAFEPHARLFNLETAVTTRETRASKRINFRMNPANLGCVLAAEPTCCALANNHTLDWGEEGLAETLEHLRRADVRTAGAGLDQEEAWRPAVIPLSSRCRLVMFACASLDSGVPPGWAAGSTRPGLAMLDDLSRRQVEKLNARIAAVRQPGDFVVVSIHWGANFGYRISPEHTAFARQLVDLAGVDCVHGHSSHHPRGFEVYRGRLILFGCGDVLNDYEGLLQRTARQRLMRRIHDVFGTGYRCDIAIIYLATFDGSTRELTGLELVPYQITRMRLQALPSGDRVWLRAVLDRQGRRRGLRIMSTDSETLHVALPRSQGHSG